MSGLLHKLPANVNPHSFEALQFNLEHFQLISTTLDGNGSVYAQTVGPPHEQSAIFLSPRMSRVLVKCREVFTSMQKIHAAPPYQHHKLYIYQVSCTYNDNVISLMQAVMQSPTYEALRATLLFLQDLVPSFHPIIVNIPCSQTDEGVWEEVFRCVTQFTFISYVKAVLKKIVEHQLNNVMAADPYIRSLLRSYLSIPLLPHGMMRRGFITLSKRAQRSVHWNTVMPFLIYYLNTWMKGKRYETLSVFTQTNCLSNVPDVAKRNLLLKTGSYYPDTLRLISAIQQYEICSYVSSRLDVSRGQKVSTLRNDAIIRDYTAQLLAGEMSIKKFLKVSSTRVIGGGGRDESGERKPETDIIDSLCMVELTRGELSDFRLIVKHPLFDMSNNNNLRELEELRRQRCLQRMAREEPKYDEHGANNEPPPSDVNGPASQEKQEDSQNSEHVNQSDSRENLGVVQGPLLSMGPQDVIMMLQNLAKLVAIAFPTVGHGNMRPPSSLPLACLVNSNTTKLDVDPLEGTSKSHVDVAPENSKPAGVDDPLEGTSKKYDQVHVLSSDSETDSPSEFQKARAALERKERARERAECVKDEKAERDKKASKRKLYTSDSSSDDTETKPPQQSELLEKLQSFFKLAKSKKKKTTYIESDSSENESDSGSKKKRSKRLFAKSLTSKTKRQHNSSGSEIDDPAHDFGSKPTPKKKANKEEDPNRGLCSICYGGEADFIIKCMHAYCATCLARLKSNKKGCPKCGYKFRKWVKYYP